MGILASKLLKAASPPLDSADELAGLLAEGDYEFPAEPVEKANALPGLLARLSAGTPADVSKDRYRLAPVETELAGSDLYDTMIKHGVANDPVLRDQSGEKVGDIVGGLFVWPEAGEHEGQHVPAESPWAGVKFTKAAWNGGNPPTVSLSADGLRAA